MQPAEPAKRVVVAGLGASEKLGFILASCGGLLWIQDWHKSVSGD